jgi:hypothetical protein
LPINVKLNLTQIVSQLASGTPEEFSSGKLETMGGSSLMATFSQDANAQCLEKNILCTRSGILFSEFFPATLQS